MIAPPSAAPAVISWLAVSVEIATSANGGGDYSGHGAETTSAPPPTYCSKGS
jgi:hypothetical protein